MATLTDVSERLVDCLVARQEPARRRSSIHLRLEDGTRELIDTAASVLGKSRTEFMIETARRHAIGVLLDQRLFVLAPNRHDAFTQALDNPRPAGARLKALMRRRPLWKR